MLTTELKKGDFVILKNGWRAQLLENSSNTSLPLCQVWGDYTEAGSVFSHDMLATIEPVDQSGARAGPRVRDHFKPKGSHEDNRIWRVKERIEH